MSRQQVDYGPLKHPIWHRDNVPQLGNFILRDGDFDCYWFAVPQEKMKFKENGKNKSIYFTDIDVVLYLSGDFCRKHTVIYKDGRPESITTVAIKLLHAAKEQL